MVSQPDHYNGSQVFQQFACAIGCYDHSMDTGALPVAVQWVDIDEGHEGQRVDNFLMGFLKGVPKSHVYRILRSGEVRRNGGRIRPQDRLMLGDRLRIPPVRRPLQMEPVGVSPHWQAELEARVLFEDEDLLVLNKPSGLAVHGGSGIRSGVIETLRLMRPEARFLELVHRLDRETSGCLLIAKRRSALRSLHEQFREDDVNKVYLALLSGVCPWKQHLVNAPLRKNILKSGERLVCVARDGKDAKTLFKRICGYQESTLVEARPITGRTHQIRVHALHMGHPLVGDERYGDEATNRSFKSLGLKRLFLHAQEAGFRHPGHGNPMRVVAPLDASLEKLLQVIPS